MGQMSEHLFFMRALSHPLSVIQLPVPSLPRTKRNARTHCRRRENGRSSRAAHQHHRRKCCRNPNPGQARLLQVRCLPKVQLFHASSHAVQFPACTVFVPYRGISNLNPVFYIALEPRLPNMVCGGNRKPCTTSLYNHLLLSAIPYFQGIGAK